VAAKVAGDLAAPGGVPDQDHLAQVELLNEPGQVAGVGVQVMAGPGLAGAAVAAAVVGDSPEAVVGNQLAWSSQASAFNGQPWLNTTGWPVPQSL